MKRDDSPLLSAYLDNQLEPEARLRVEAALESDPRLVLQLRDLERLRDALRALPKPPAPVGFAFRALSRIEHAEAHRRRRQRERSIRFRRFLVLAPITAAAASLLILWSVEGLTRPDPGLTFRPKPVEPAVSALVQAPTQPDAPPPLVVAEADAPAADPSPTPLELARLQGQEQLLKLLGRPEAARIVLRVDRLDDPSLAAVESAIGGLVRSDPRHARLRIPSGLSIDPGHDGPAVVFAVPLEETEPDRLLDLLTTRFPGRALRVQAVPPTLLAQLGETVRFEFGQDEAPAASPLVEPSERVLHATKSEPPRLPDHVQVLGPPAGPDLEIVAPPTVSLDQSDPEPEAPDEAPAPEPPARPRGPSVYLIWVVEG